MTSPVAPERPAPCLKAGAAHFIGAGEEGVPTQGRLVFALLEVPVELSLSGTGLIPYLLMRGAAEEPARERYSPDSHLHSPGQPF